VLLDTHVMLWLLTDDPRIGRVTRRRIVNANAVLVSAASIWEAAIKSAAARLEVPDDLIHRLERDGLALLPITPEDTWAIRGLSGLTHGDPFDRLLVAQAISLGVPLVTADRALLAAEITPAVEVIDARG
jgi:PIN domain nuclease of toxin-antitoxin system